MSSPPTSPSQNFEAFTADEIFRMFFQGVHPNDIANARRAHGNRQYGFHAVCGQTACKNENCSRPCDMA